MWPQGLGLDFTDRHDSFLWPSSVPVGQLALPQRANSVGTHLGWNLDGRRQIQETGSSSLTTRTGP